MEYVEFTIADDFKRFIKCENEKEALLVDTIQRKLNDVYDFIKKHDYRFVHEYYEYNHETYSEFASYFRIWFFLNMIDSAEWIYEAKRKIHEHICSLIDEKRGER